jgi:hypothetical protein
LSNTTRAVGGEGVGEASRGQVASETVKSVELERDEEDKGNRVLQRQQGQQVREASVIKEADDDDGDDDDDDDGCRR